MVLVSPVIGILLLHAGRREAREAFPESAHDAFPCPLREPDDPTASDDPEHLVHGSIERTLDAECTKCAVEAPFWERKAILVSFQPLHRGTVRLGAHATAPHLGGCDVHRDDRGSAPGSSKRRVPVARGDVEHPHARRHTRAVDESV